jgi:BMFP domain-containing protein YqiC
MEIPSFVEDLQQRLAAMFASSPAADIQRNMKALLNQQFARLDLITREEFDAQREVLAKTRQKLDALEAKIAQLELGRK